MSVKVNKTRKILLTLIILLIPIICILIYFKPMPLSQNVKSEAINCAERMSFDAYTDNVYMTDYCCYLDSDDKYDYYCSLEYSYNSGKYTDKDTTHLLKIKDNKIINKYDLSDLNTDSILHVERGICNNNYLYFVARSNNAVYRIDCDFNSCELYIEGSQFGNISYSSLSFYDNYLLYITDSGNIVKYSDGKEELFLTVPSIRTVFGGDKIDLNEFVSEYNTTTNTNYLISTNGKKTYCAAKNKLFLYNHSNQKGKEIRLNLSDYTYIQKLSFSKENDDLLFVYYSVNIGPWEPITRHVAVYNTKTGCMRKIEQSVENRSRSWKVPKLELEPYKEDER